MRYKLDENLGTRIQDLLCAQGHDVQTVRSEELQGCTDARLYEVCGEEHHQRTGDGYRPDACRK